jgi:hypothetical protein
MAGLELHDDHGELTGEGRDGVGEMEQEPRLPPVHCGEEGGVPWGKEWSLARCFVLPCAFSVASVRKRSKEKREKRKEEREGKKEKKKIGIFFKSEIFGEKNKR